MGVDFFNCTGCNEITCDISHMSCLCGSYYCMRCGRDQQSIYGKGSDEGDGLDNCDKCKPKKRRKTRAKKPKVEKPKVEASPIIEKPKEIILYLVQYQNSDSYISTSTDFITTDLKLAEKKRRELEDNGNKGGISKYDDSEPESEEYIIKTIYLKPGELLEI